MARTRMENLEIADELAGCGLRATRQRIAVLTALRSQRHHPTASDTYRQLLKDQPNLSLKTVYDALDALVGAGLARCVTDGGEPYRYEANTDPHYHTQCRSCGALEDIPARADGHIRGRTEIPRVSMSKRSASRSWGDARAAETDSEPRA